MVRAKLDKTINVLLSFDDANGDYTRHAAVTIFSLLDTNKNNKIKIWIMSSYLSHDNICELKRIVNLYNQEIEFIIRDDIISEDLKSVIINKRELSRGARYRLFFPQYIKGIDRILYVDCDVLFVKDIFNIYNMDMKGKGIAGYNDIVIFNYKNDVFEVENYINSGVLLFDVNSYDVSKMTVNKIKDINEKYGEFFNGCDQDKINLIFKDDIIIGKKGMNYQIRNKFSIKGIDNAEIIHCLEKPYVQYSSIPSKFVKLYYEYLDLTKWKGYPKQKANYGYLKHLYITIYKFCYSILISVLGEKFMRKVNSFIFRLKDNIFKWKNHKT